MQGQQCLPEALDQDTKHVALLELCPLNLALLRKLYLNYQDSNDDHELFTLSPCALLTQQGSAAGEVDSI